MKAAVWHGEKDIRIEEVEPKQLEELSKERLSKLNNITAPELKAVVEALCKKKKAGYQEALVDEMVNDLKSKL